MTEFVTEYYLWVKAFHLISVIAWMAGLLYLPRLFVYHCQVDPKSEASEKFKIMERKLLRGIINPSMILVFVFGLMLTLVVPVVSGWFHSKVMLVLFLLGSHGMMAKFRKDFEQDKNTRTEKFYRIFNEIPAVLMVLIVILVVVKPF